jgi:heptaprenylglyceryl phosphate synthase
VLPLVRQIRFLEEGTLSLAPEEKRESLKVIPEYIKTTEKIPAEVAASDYTVQVASCLFQKSAETVKNKLDDRYAHVFISVVENATGTYHVVKIPAGDFATAKKIVKELIGIGYDPIIKYK